MPGDMINFSGNFAPIEIDLADASVYHNCSSFDSAAMQNGFTWHRIIVHHNGQLQYLSDPKKVILAAFFEHIDGDEFFPVGYECGRREDKFLVRKCRGALEKLFKRNLRIKTSTGASIALTIELNCAAFRYGQISPVTQMNKVLSAALNNLEKYKDIDGIVNLCEFSTKPGFEHICISLANTAILQMACDFIYASDDKFRRINGLALRGNDLSNVTPLGRFQTDFMILDLRDNRLSSPSRFVAAMEKVRAVHLLLSGNPLLKSPKYISCITRLAPNFQYVDNVLVTELGSLESSKSRDVQMDYKGFRIDSSNKEDIAKFASSPLWHALSVPDKHKEYSKDLIMDCLFLTISPELSTFYPCYYKFENNEHQMLIRNCYDQLYHLAEVCDFEIKVPQLSPTVNASDNGNFETLPYFLRMNVAPYHDKQVDPKTAFSNAIVERFSKMERVLNLENFQDSPGLDVIVVNLSSKKILYEVLQTASGILLGSCTDLRLGRNKITSMNFPKTLSLLTSLHSLDIGNNWIHSLSQVSELGVLPLKSLRLDGNPLCQDYALANEYVKDVTKIFRQLKSLDGVALKGVTSLTPQKNFICDTAAYDIVQQFVPQYFELFESSDRTSLMKMYCEDAVFTLCFDVELTANVQQMLKRLSKYKMYASNIREGGGSSGIHRKIQGFSDIIYIFLEWPKMEHDILTFNTDVMHFSSNEIVINVSGAFRDVAPTPKDIDLKMGFNRTFRLIVEKENDGLLECNKRYRIKNEHLDIFNLTESQERNAFKYYKYKDDDDKPQLSAIDKEHLLVMFQELTHLKSIWCTRCLDDTEWDFKKALQNFIDLCEKNEIPENAFL